MVSAQKARVAETTLKVQNKVAQIRDFFNIVPQVYQKTNLKHVLQLVVHLLALANILN
jgi:hypothetical protein